MVVKRLATSHAETSQELLLLDKKMSILPTKTYHAKKVRENKTKQSKIFPVVFHSLIHFTSTLAIFAPLNGYKHWVPGENVRRPGPLRLPDSTYVCGSCRRICRSRIKLQSHLKKTFKELCNDYLHTLGLDWNMLISE